MVREVEVRHARLDPGEAVLGADLEDAGHARGRDHERVADRRGGAREARAAPRGTIGRPWAAAARTHACTCSVVVGNATSAHPPSTIDASRAYRRRASGSESTASGPSAASSSRRAASTSAMTAGYRSTVGAWAELEVGDPELAAFGRERFEGQGRVPRDAAPRRRAPPAPGLAVVRRRPAARRLPGAQPEERRGRARRALRDALGDRPREPRGRGRRVPRARVDGAGLAGPSGRGRGALRGAYELAIYACSVEEAVGTTYPGGGSPVYRRWRG